MKVKVIHLTQRTIQDRLTFNYLIFMLSATHTDRYRSIRFSDHFHRSTQRQESNELRRMNPVRVSVAASKPTHRDRDYTNNAPIQNNTRHGKTQQRRTSKRNVFSAASSYGPRQRRRTNTSGFTNRAQTPFRADYFAATPTHCDARSGFSRVPSPVKTSCPVALKSALSFAVHSMPRPLLFSFALSTQSRGR